MELLIVYPKNGTAALFPSTPYRNEPTWWRIKHSNSCLAGHEVIATESEWRMLSSIIVKSMAGNISRLVQLVIINCEIPDNFNALE